jgi:hypothetical protein
MRRMIYVAVILSALFIGCTSGRPAVISGWENASLVTEQRLEIERQRQYIADLERIIQSGSENLRAAEQYLGELEQGNTDLADWLRRVDEFVRAVITVQREFESVQRANRPEDAGEGPGPGLGL